jgi:hypothetical protein
MGIGAAFATGLVQGFTQNIQEEKARRLADQQKLDALNQLVLKSAMDKNASQSGIEAVSNLIKSSQKQLDEREPIDIFGRQTDGLDIDFTKLAGIVNKKELDYNTTITGGGETLGFQSQFGKTVNQNTAIQFLSEVAALGDDAITKLKANPELYAALDGQINAARGIVNNAIAGDAIKAGKGVEAIIPFDYDFLDSYYKQFDKETPAAPETVADNVATAVKTGTGEVVDSVFVDKSGVQTVTFETADQKASLAIVAKSLGTTPTNAGNIFVERLKDVPLMTPQRASDLFVTSVKIGAIPGIAGLDPDVALRRITSQDQSQILQTMLDVLGDSNFASADTYNNLVYALAPYMTPPQRKQVTVAGRKTQTFGKSRNEYILDRTGGLYKTFGELEDAARRNTDVVDDLLSYRANLAGLEEGTIAYAAFKATAAAVVDIGKGVVSDVAGFFFTGEEEEGKTYFTDRDQLDTYVNQRVEEQRRLGEKTGQGNLFAELEAMRISLAFQLARAADPSGRLSNQDIEVQLVRLGSNFRVKEDALAALGVVISDVSRERDRLNALANLGGTDDITDADARLVDASVAVTKLVTNRNRLAARGKAVAQEAATTLTPPVEGAQPSGQFTAEDGSPVYPALGQNGIPMTDPSGSLIYVDLQGNRVTDLTTKAPDAAPAPTPAARVTAQPPAQQPTTVQVPKQPPQPDEQPEEAAPAGSVSIDDVRGGDVTPKPLGTSPQTFELTRGANRLPGIYTWDSATQSFIPMK